MGFQCKNNMTEMGDSLLRTNHSGDEEQKTIGYFKIKIIVAWIRVAVKVGEWLDFGSILMTADKTC